MDRIDNVGTGLVELAKFRHGGVSVLTKDSHTVRQAHRPERSRRKGCPYEFNFMLIRNKLHQRKSPRLKGFDYSKPFAYFVTICAIDKQRIFCNEDLNNEIINCLKQKKEKVGVEVFAYCLMPDHFHMLISPRDTGLNISRFIGGFKSKTTRIGWKYGIKAKMWQGRFHDHILRPDETVNDVCEYILNNPVRGNLASSWEDYKFCGLIDLIPA